MLKVSNIPVVYEDEWFLVVDKPAGLLTIPTPRKETRTLTSILNDDALIKGISCRIYPCHRLDRETSGLIIYAKGKSAQKKMMEAFGRRSIKKKYTAFAHGRLSSREGKIQYPIEGHSAVTGYRVVEERGAYSIVEVAPQTGRTNQIRIHFKRIGHPLVGETKFAFRRDFKLRAKRLLLHAEKIEFIHPMTGKNMRLLAPLPRDMADFLCKNP
ncbi:MAG: RluA family pseudouridine synthase [Candidatus Omnitrophota bacterium]|jgi:23S rRNA pseudouridine1911/1915/1917 synthase